MAAANGETVKPTIRSDGSAVFESPRTPLIHAVIALGLWIGVIHLFFASMVLPVLFLPLSKVVLVYAFLLFLAVIPISEEGSEFTMKLRRYIVKHVTGYFPMTVHVEDIKALKPEEAHVLVVEPHSVLPLGVISLVHVTDFLGQPNYRVLASSAVFRTPFLRHVWTWMSLAAVTRKNFTSLLKSGYTCVIIPGGARETLHMTHDSEIVYLKARKGFIRTAMETGRPLIPVYAFGQSATYKWWKPSGDLFLWLCKIIQYTPMIFWGAFGSFIPHRVPLHVVVGRPIEVKENPNPSVEEVNELHGKFLEALQDLFERHKARLGYPDRQLKII